MAVLAFGFFVTQNRNASNSNHAAQGAKVGESTATVAMVIAIASVARLAFVLLGCVIQNSNVSNSNHAA